MTLEPTYSDEPTRVAKLVSAFLTGQSGSVLGDRHGPSATLVIGADQRDDCATYDLSGPVTLVAGSDYVRGPKFALYEQGLLTNYDIGYYVVAANVSDIAAMGGVPHYVLVSIAIPSSHRPQDIDRMYEGIMAACRQHRVQLIGGDTSASKQGLFINISLLGSVTPHRALRRDRARAGDGPLGLPVLLRERGGTLWLCLDDLFRHGSIQKGGEGRPLPAGHNEG
jgi:thiamine-monophosphate kinase